MKLLNKLFGTKNERDIKKMQPRIQAIAGFESQLEKKSDEELAARLGELRNEVQNALKASGKAYADWDKELLNNALSPVTNETFALVREAGKRVLGMRHYDVQMIGGLALNDGRIAEMKTGEGKTLVATLPSVLNALIGKGVHVVTVNDYLASRDAEWMGRLYRFLGLSVGVVVARQGEVAKKQAYEADITYGQNNEFGFDYLRDNMKFSLRDYKQRGHAFAVIDEVDSILIDEARTPLIISGPAEDNTENYVTANKIVPQLRKDEHYTIDEKARNVMLTETGVERVERLLKIDNLYDPNNIEFLHHVSVSLKAHSLYKRDSDYVVDAGKVVIVDDHTGRLMPGRRWSDGLHGAIEAKENVKIENETQTLATVTFQNYFRMYKKLSGMTGTADTEAEEFAKIYSLDVLVIPTNKPIARLDQQDLIYKTEAGKFMAIADDIADYHENGNPILVGTVSVEKSEVLSRHLKKKGIDHKVLNAKMHRDEAAIVAQAGQLGAVTIATNMAGRGTDILLGGNPEHMARTAVAAAIGQSSDQVAEFAFLSGRPDPILVEKLAERDSRTGKYLAAWHERVEELKEEAAETGKKFIMPEDMPQTVEDAQNAVYADRLAFYQSAVDEYSKHLGKFEEICGKAKAEVKEAGGLRIIGTERHESRRIDNQLRGRAGRQGDPGSSRFYLSLEDDLMRIFANERMVRMMEMLGFEDDVPIEHNMVSKSIEGAQKRVEGMHFDTRKNTLEYDDVMNQQRKAIYGMRRAVLEADPSRDVHEINDVVVEGAMRELVLDFLEDKIVQTVASYCPEKTNPQEWKIREIENELQQLLGVHIDLLNVDRNVDDIQDKCFAECERFIKAKEERVGVDVLAQVAGYIELNTIDARWKEHLQHMDHLREGIHMRAYGQKDPKQEYKKEGFRMFQSLRGTIRDETLEKIYRAEISQSADEEREKLERQRRQRRRAAKQQAKNQSSGHASSSTSGSNGATAKPSAAPAVRTASGVALPNTAPVSTGPALPKSRATDTSNLNRAQRRKVKANKKKKVRLR